MSRPYKLACREFKPERTLIHLDGITLGGDELTVMAGPCTVESEQQINLTAGIAARLGVRILRGGAFKPRSSPYSFQGLGERGLQLLRAAADAHRMLVITEVMDTSQVEMVARYADILQVGARNMQHFELLKALGRVDRPVLLKRGLAATLEEWLMAAEYLLAGGNQQVILCERGIRIYGDHVRFMLDVGAIPAVKALSHLPVIVDPSHAAGQREMVTPLALAGIAAGADGLLVEIHNQPEQALCDGPQALLPHQFARLLEQVADVAIGVGRFVRPVPVEGTQRELRALGRIA